VWSVNNNRSMQIVTLPDLRACWCSNDLYQSRAQNALRLKTGWYRQKCPILPFHSFLLTQRRKLGFWHLISIDQLLSKQIRTAQSRNAVRRYVLSMIAEPFQLHGGGDGDGDGGGGAHWATRDFVPFLRTQQGWHWQLGRRHHHT